MMIQMPRSMTRWLSSPRARPHQRELESQQVRGGQRDAVGVDGEAAEIKQDWVHDGVRLDHLEQHENGSDGDGGVGDVEGPEVRLSQ